MLDDVEEKDKMDLLLLSKRYAVACDNLVEEENKAKRDTNDLYNIGTALTPNKFVKENSRKMEKEKVMAVVSPEVDNFVSSGTSIMTQEGQEILDVDILGSVGNMKEGIEVCNMKKDIGVSYAGSSTKGGKGKNYRQKQEAVGSL